MFSKIWSFIVRNFGQGLLLIVPFAVTAYFLYWLYSKINSLVVDANHELGIPIFDKGGTLDLSTPGLGIIMVILVVMLVGIIGSKLISLPIFNYFSRLLEKAPLIGIIYSAIKDLMAAFVGNKKKFTEPVLVQLNKNTEVEQIGFITQHDLKMIGLEKSKIAIYLPFPYSFMGNLYIVPSDNVTPLDISPTQAMKFIVSGGVSINEEEEEKKADE